MSTANLTQFSARMAKAPGSCRFLLATALATLLAACAVTKPADSLIRERAQARWDALLSGDLDTAYGFYSPGYRSSQSRVDFEIELRTRRVRWESATVQEVSCEADNCTVKTDVGYKVARAVPGVNEWKSHDKINENWVRTDGQWWYLPGE